MEHNLYNLHYNLISKNEMITYIIYTIYKVYKRVYTAFRVNSYTTHT